MIRDYIGIPFSLKGRDFSGADCWGLVLLWYENEYGVKLKSFHEDYEDISDKGGIESATRKERKNWEKTSEPEIGNVVLIRITGAEMHTGIYIGEGKMLHVMQGINSCIENLREPKWSQRVVGYYKCR